MIIMVNYTVKPKQKPMCLTKKNLKDNLRLIIRNHRTLLKLCTQFVLTFFQVHPDEQFYDFSKIILILDVPTG